MYSRVEAAHRKTREVEAQLEIASRQLVQVKAQRNLLQRQRDDQAHRVAGDKADAYIRHSEQLALQAIANLL